MRYVLDWVSLVVMYMRRRGRAQAAPMHAGWLERTDQPSSSAYCQTLCWPLMVLFSLFFVTWPDRSYLNQPRSESDAFPNTALRSPSCASSDRRGAKPSLSAVPVVGTNWNKVMFVFTGNPRGGTRGFTVVKQRIKDSCRGE